MPLLTGTRAGNSALPQYNISARVAALYALPNLVHWLDLLPNLLDPTRAAYAQDRSTGIVHPINGTLTMGVDGAKPAGVFNGSQSIDLSTGLISSSSLMGGTGGTDGYYLLIVPAGAAGSSQASYGYTVTGGTVVSMTRLSPGSGYSGNQNLTNAAFAYDPVLNPQGCVGLTGASVTLNVGGLFPTNHDYTIAVRVNRNASTGGTAHCVLGAKTSNYHSVHFDPSTGNIRVTNSPGGGSYNGTVGNAPGTSAQIIVGFTAVGGRLTVLKNGSQEYQASGYSAAVDSSAVIGDLPGLTGDFKLRAALASILVLSEDVTQPANSADLAVLVANV